MAETLTISRLARLGGVNLETIRYYEREGLLPAPPRTAAGYRVFPALRIKPGAKRGRHADAGPSKDRRYRAEDPDSPSHEEDLASTYRAM